MLEPLFRRLKAVYPELVELRRDLHRHPELSFEEVETPRKIAAHLKKLGLEVKEGVGGRGVVGWLKGGKPGPTVALRADFDALNIQDEKHVPYKSTIDGKMHACGHDIHTATLLGVANVLSEVRAELAGNVVFIHQFAEELTPGGAKPMIEDGCLDGVDVIYGAHVWAGIPYGAVGVRSGHTMAAVDAFDIEIKGRGGHGAEPHLTIDPIVIGSQLVQQLQQIVSRKVNPLKAAVVTVGSFHGGDAFNVIPDSAKMKGTVRTFDPAVRDLVAKQVQRTVEAAAQQSGADIKLDYLRGYPALVNHEQETSKVEALANKLLGEQKVLRMEPMMGGEDFAYYLEQVPGAFFFVGGGNPEIGAAYPHHHPLFDVDERSMLISGQLFISLVLNTLSAGKIVPEHTAVHLDVDSLQMKS